MPEGLSGKVAWVTGAGSGMGLAIAKRLALTGAKVALTGRSAGPLDEAAASIAAEGGQALVVPADVSDAKAIGAVADKIIEAWGRCDILVNSAGLNVQNRSWSQIEPDDFDRVLTADLSGCFYTSRAVLPTMRRQGDGLIVHISSWAGRYVSPLTGPAYTAAKHGLNALSESLNQVEYVHGIRSCCICPGEVATPLLNRRPVPVSAEEKARMLQVEDVADIVAFVAQAPASVCINEILVSPTWNRTHPSI